jgi:hypothetical protein
LPSPLVASQRPLAFGGPPSETASALTHVCLPGGAFYAPYSVAVGDLNSDGKLDLATADNLLNKVSALLGNGDGTFQTQVDYDTGADSRQVATGDFNGDGKLDLAVSLFCRMAAPRHTRLVRHIPQCWLDPAGNYSFTILLRAGLRDNDLNGRQYTIRVSAKDNAGNRGVRWARVTVPHDQPH